MRIRQRIDLLEKNNHAFEAVLQHLHLGVVLLDDGQDVAFMNPEALRAFSKCSDIQCHLHHRFQLTTRKQDHTNSFPPIEKQPTNEKRKIVSDDTSIKIEHRHGHLKLSFFTLDDTHTRAYASYTKHGLPANTHYLVLLQDSQRHCNLPFNYLKQAYGITPAESELIAHLINGSSLLEAAEKRAVTHETTRWQMKNIMQKTQVHSQIQLSQLMLSLMEG